MEENLRGKAFVVNIDNTEDGTWHGRITWLATNETVCFRSAFEMVHLIDSALDSNN